MLSGTSTALKFSYSAGIHLPARICDLRNSPDPTQSPAERNNPKRRKNGRKKGCGCNPIPRILPHKRHFRCICTTLGLLHGGTFCLFLRVLPAYLSYPAEDLVESDSVQFSHLPASGYHAQYTLYCAERTPVSISDISWAACYFLLRQLYAKAPENLPANASRNGLTGEDLLVARLTKL